MKSRFLAMVAVSMILALGVGAASAYNIDDGRSLQTAMPLLDDDALRVVVHPSEEGEESRGAHDGREGLGQDDAGLVAGEGETGVELVEGLEGVRPVLRFFLGVVVRDAQL